MFYDNRAATSDFVVRYNIFCQAAASRLRLHGRDWTSGLTLDANCWFQRKGPLLLWGDTPVGADGFFAFQEARGLSARALIAEPRFVHAAARDYRLAPDCPARQLQDDGAPPGALP